METRLDRAERHVGFHGDALERHVLEEAQRDDLTLVGWQALDGSAQPAGVFVLHHVAQWIGAFVTHQVHGGRDVGRLMAASGLRSGHGRAPRDAPHPRSKRAIATVPGKGAESLDERVLSCILRLIGIAQHLQAHADHGARLAFDQQPVRIAIAGQHGIDQCSVVHAGGSH